MEQGFNLATEKACQIVSETYTNQDKQCEVYRPGNCHFMDRVKLANMV